MAKKLNVYNVTIAFTPFCNKHIPTYQLIHSLNNAMSQAGHAPHPASSGDHFVESDVIPVELDVAPEEEDEVMIFPIPIPVLTAPHKQPLWDVPISPFHPLVSSVRNSRGG